MGGAGGAAYYHPKYRRVVGELRLTDPPAPLEPEAQTEPHTFGYHALSSLHRSDGLDAEALRLRFRLGVDQRAINTDPDSVGTIHPDLFRVLVQDGFDIDPRNPRDPDDQQKLRAHLDTGHYAVALTKADAYHWVVIAGHDGDELIVCDSLRPVLYRRAYGPYLREHVYTLVLVRPEAAGETTTIAAVHKLGLAEMLRVRERAGGG